MASTLLTLHKIVIKQKQGKTENPSACAKRIYFVNSILRSTVTLWS